MLSIVFLALISFSHPISFFGVLSCPLPRELTLSLCQSKNYRMHFVIDSTDFKLESLKTIVRASYLPVVRIIAFTGSAPESAIAAQLSICLTALFTKLTLSSTGRSYSKCTDVVFLGIARFLSDQADVSAGPDIFATKAIKN